MNTFYATCLILSYCGFFSLHGMEPEILDSAADARPSSSLPIILKERLLQRNTHLKEIMHEASKFLVLMNSPNWVSAVLEAAFQACSSVADCTKLEIACLLNARGALDVWIEHQVQLLRDQTRLEGALDYTKGTYTPLTAAIQSGSCKIVKVLVKAGARVDVKDSFGNTPLIAAASRGSLKMVRYLVLHGAQDTMCETNKSGCTALGVAIRANAADSVSLLLAQGALTSANDSAELLNSAILGTHVEMVAMLLKAGADPCGTYRGLPLLLRAIQHSAMVRGFFSRVLTYSSEKQTEAENIVKLLLEHIPRESDLRPHFFNNALLIAEAYQMDSTSEALQSRLAESYSLPTEVGVCGNYSIDDFQTVVAQEFEAVPFERLIRIFVGIDTDTVSVISDFLGEEDPQEAFRHNFVSLKELFQAMDTQGILETIEDSRFATRCNHYMFGVKFSLLMRLKVLTNELLDKNPEQYHEASVFLNFLKKKDSFVGWNPDSDNQPPILYRILLRLGILALMQDMISLTHEIDVIAQNKEVYETDDMQKKKSKVKEKIITLMRLLKDASSGFLRDRGL